MRGFCLISSNLGERVSGVLHLPAVGEALCSLALISLSGDRGEKNRHITMSTRFCFVFFFRRGKKKNPNIMKEKQGCFEAAVTRSERWRWGWDGLRGGGWKTPRPSTSALAPPSRGAGACRDGTKNGETGGHKYKHTSSGGGEPRE